MEILSDQWMNCACIFDSTSEATCKTVPAIWGMNYAFFLFSESNSIGSIGVERHSALTADGAWTKLHGVVKITQKSNVQSLMNISSTR